MAQQQFYGGPLGISAPALWTQEIVKASSFTVLKSQCGALFRTTGAVGAVTFTLPAIEKGLVFGFYNDVDQNMIVVRAGSNTILADGNAAATTLTFSTSSHKIGSACIVYADSTGTKWLVHNLGGTAMTVS